MGNNQSTASKEIERRISIKGGIGAINKRLTVHERDRLVKAFDQLQSENMINKVIFRIEVMGAQVPDVISDRIFHVFATKQSAASLSRPSQQNQTILGSG